MPEKKSDDKGRAITRYVIAEAGLVGMEYVPREKKIVGNGYEFKVAVSGIDEAHWLSRYVGYIPDVPGGLVRYDTRRSPALADTLIITRLGLFVPLLKAHYDTVVRPRRKELE